MKTMKKTNHSEYKTSKLKIVLVFERYFWLTQGRTATLKDLGTFSNTKHNVHRFTLNVHGLKIMIIQSLSY